MEKGDQGGDAAINLSSRPSSVPTDPNNEGDHEVIISVWSIKTCSPGVHIYIQYTYIYRPFHKALPRFSASLNRISVRFYETDCSSTPQFFFYLYYLKYFSSLYNFEKRISDIYLKILI